MDDFEGTRVVVTGGGSGIGADIARALAKRGATVWITGRTAEKLAAVADEDDRIVPFVCDVTDDNAILALRDVLDAAGGVDVLVNNAGVFHRFDMVTGPPLDAQLSEIDIDVSGPVRMAHHFLPGMIERGGTLVNVSSGLAFVPYASAPVYSASKAFVHAWTQSLRAQLAGSGVRVVELMPPVVATPMAEGLDPSIERISPEELTTAFLTGLSRGHTEITPGISKQLKWMRRLAPNFIFNRLNARLRPRVPAAAK